ncbi:MAG: hypothetical protein KME49_26250 [Brasilonema octagenarum HA4186-MV1]|jgi:hypothetical protein|nr:hypothetical protein [Brasilonema octagenarum HA4186-MV1]
MRIANEKVRLIEGGSKSDRTSQKDAMKSQIGLDQVDTLFHREHYSTKT